MRSTPTGVSGRRAFAYDESPTPAPQRRPSTPPGGTVRKLLSLVAVAAAAMLVVGSAANAAPVNNPACAGTKIDPVLSGTYALPYADGLGFVTITVRDT